MSNLRLVIALGHVVAFTSALGSEVKPSRDSAWTGEETLRSIELDGPYEAQLVAAEPLVMDPVEVCWDAKGVCYVADMLDYPMGGADGKPISRVQRLIDDNGDGVYDKAVTFADHLDHVQGLLPHRDGLVITTRTQVLFLRDKDGDGVADERVPLISGFNPSFSQLQVSSPRWGLDGEIHFNNGLDAKEIYPGVDEAAKQSVVRDNIRWNPRTGKIHTTSGIGQYGGAFDDWGRHFFSSNRSPVMFGVMPREAEAGGRTQYWENIAPAGSASRVYPIQITHTTSDAHSGTNTSACGITVYRGDLMPGLRGEVFVCDPTGQLITRFHSPKPDGASLSSDRVGHLTEFFRSRDEWCRPVNLTTGPDGALYVCDIYRQYIDHARFFPDEFVKTHNMRAGEGQGRIWRIVPKGVKGSKAIRKIEAAPTGVKEQVAWLAHDNAWQRETAQRLLLEQAEKGEAAKVLEGLRAYASSVPLSPLARVHCLWTYAVVWSAAPDAVKAPHAKDPWIPVPRGQWSPELAENVILIASRYPEMFKGDRASMLEQARDRGLTRARMLWLAMLDSSANEMDEALKRPADLEDEWYQSALIGRFKGRTGELAGKLLGSDFSRESSAPKVALVRSLSAVTAAGSSVSDFGKLVVLLEREPGKLLWWKPAILQGLAEGLPKSDGKVAGKSLAQFIKDPREGMEVAREIPGLLAQLDQVVFDAKAPLELRLASLPLIGQRPHEEGGPLLVKLLGSDQPPEISALAFSTLKRAGAVTIAPLLYAALPTSGPSIRKDIVSTLAGDAKMRVDLLERMDRGEVPKSLLDAEARWSLLQVKTEPVKTLAEKLFQRPSEDRAKVVAEYLPSTKAKGDASKGREIFTNICSACHSFKGIGTAVGPDISDVRAREKDALLNDILDPNRMIEARWSANKVVLKDGRTLLGLMDSEGEKEITLRMPGGLKESIRRDQIHTFEALDTSLMPVGLEGGITTTQMADLLAFLRGE